jgi:hypothetical protein
VAVAFVLPSGSNYDSVRVGVSVASGLADSLNAGCDQLVQTGSRRSDRTGLPRRREPRTVQPEADHMLHKRRLIAFVCLAAILLVALTPAVASSHCVFLVPLDPLFGSVVIPQPLPVVNADSYESIVLEITGSRPPPSR